MNARSLAIILILSYTTTVAFAAQLNFTVYNAKKKGIFGTASTLISDDQCAIQFDAQFTTTAGAEVDEIIHQSNKKLELIVISAADPDFYFGLQPIVKSYPNVKIVASERVRQQICATMDEKLAYWDSSLKDGMPTELYVPELLNGTVIFLGDKRIELKKQDGFAAYYWIPEDECVLGGNSLSWNIHVFTGNTPTVSSRLFWQQVLREMIARKPKLVVPGHYLGVRPAGYEAVTFTLKYLETFEYVLIKNRYKNSTAVIDEMKKFYPHLEEVSSLEVSAKVITGELDTVFGTKVKDIKRGYFCRKGRCPCGNK